MGNRCSDRQRRYGVHRMASRAYGRLSHPRTARGALAVKRTAKDAKPKCDFCSKPALVERLWSDNFETLTKELRCAEHGRLGMYERHSYENIEHLYPIILKELADPPTDGSPYLYLKMELCT